MLNKLFSILIGTAFVVSASIVGRMILARVLQEHDRVLRWSLSSVFGIALFVVGLVLLGAAGLFHVQVVHAFFYLVAFGPIFVALTVFRLQFSEKVSRLLQELRSAPFLGWGITLLFAIGIAGIFSPETDNDSLCYHMHLAKQYLQHHRIWFHPYEWNSTFPFNLEMLYAAGYAAGGIYLAKFLHFSLAVLTALGIYGFLKKPVGLWPAQSAALLYLSSSAVFVGAMTTYVDAGLACFTFFAGIALFQGVVLFSPVLLVVGGFLWGIALGIKFLAIISGVAFAAIILWGGWCRHGFKKAVTAGAVFFSAGALTAFYWYLRSWILRGNPVFPFFYSIFKSGDGAIHYDDIGVTKTVFNFITVPWTFSIRPDLFEGYSVQFGVYFLVFAPFAFLLWKEFWVRWSAAFVFVYIACWFFLGQSLRFLTPALPFMILLAGAGQAGFSKRLDKKIASYAVVVLLLINLFFAAYYTRNQWGVALGRVSEDSFLTQTQRSYPMAQFINSQLPKNAKVFSADEIHLFYYDRLLTREAIYQKVHKLTASDLSLGDWILRLKNEGYTHLLTVENARSTDSKEPACASLACLVRVGQLAVAEYLKPLYNYDFDYTDQGVFHYQLYEIQ